MTKLDQELLNKIDDDINKNDILNKLYSEYNVKEIVQFNEYNLAEKISINPFISEQFRLLYLKEAHNLKKIEIMYDKELGIKFDYYKFNSEKNLTKTEIEKYYLPKDDKLNKLKILFNKQKLLMEFFESVWKTLDKQSWMLKMFQQELKG